MGRALKSPVLLLMKTDYSFICTYLFLFVANIPLSLSWLSKATSKSKLDLSFHLI